MAMAIGGFISINPSHEANLRLYMPLPLWFGAKKKFM